MTMKKWRFLPILVKQEVLKNMDLSERLSLAKCSKKSLHLVGGFPNLLNSVVITEESVVIDDANFQFLLNDFPFLIACPYSTIEELSVNIQTIPAKSVLENIIRSRKILKLKSLEMRFHEDFNEFYKELLEICDPSILKTIKIPRLCTTEIYQSIVNTEQWKKCKTIYLNTHDSAKNTSFLEVNYDDFLHFKYIYLGVDSIDEDNAMKLVRMYTAFTDMDGAFEVTTRERILRSFVFNSVRTEYPGVDFNPRRSLIDGLWHPNIDHCILELYPDYNSFRGQFIRMNRNFRRHLERLGIVPPL